MALAPILRFNKVNLPPNVGLVVGLGASKGTENTVVSMLLSLRFSSFGNVQTRKRSRACLTLELVMFKEVRFDEKRPKR